MNVTDQYLIFSMRGEQFALDVNRIREVLLVPKVTYIPQMPEYMKGVIDIRGSAIPLLDLGLKFGISAISIGANTSIIIVEYPIDQDGLECIHLGVLVDSVEQVITISPEQIEPATKIGSWINTSYTNGVWHHDTKFVILLDIEKILSEDELHHMEGVTEMETARTV